MIKKVWNMIKTGYHMHIIAKIFLENGENKLIGFDKGTFFPVE
jgi:hypothetical protein